MTAPMASRSTGVSRREFLATAAAVPLLLGSVATTAPGSLSTTRFVQHASRNGKHVCLTFHGSGSQSLTRQVLALTERLKAPITVFAVGTWVEANPSLIQAIVAGGNEMANHTLTHPALRRLGRADVAAEIIGCADTLRRVTGHKGAWFRPSGTPTPSTLILEESAKAGYSTVVGYDVDPRDYQDPGSRLVVSRTLAGVQAGSIVSLHLGHQGTVDALTEIVAGVRQRGLEPVTVSRLLAP